MTRRDHTRSCFGSATPPDRVSTPDAKVRIRRKSMHSSHPSPRVSGSKSNVGGSHPHERGDMRGSGGPDIAALIRATCSFSLRCCRHRGLLPSTSPAPLYRGRLCGSDPGFLAVAIGVRIARVKALAASLHLIIFGGNRRMPSEIVAERQMSCNLG